MISNQQPLNHNDISKPINAGHDEAAYAQQSSGKQGQLAGKIQQGENAAEQKLSNSGAGSAGVPKYEVHQAKVATSDGTQVITTETYRDGAPGASSTTGGAPTSHTTSGTSGAAGSGAPAQYSTQDPRAQSSTHGHHTGSTSSHHNSATSGHSGAGAAAGPAAVENKAATKDAKKEAKKEAKEDAKNSKDLEHETHVKPKSEKELAQEQYKGATTIDELQGMPGVPHKSELVDLGDAKSGPVLGPRPDYDCTPLGKAEGPGKQSSTKEATLATYSGTSDHIEPESERKTSKVDAHKEHDTSTHPTREVPTHGPKPTSNDTVTTSAAANPHHPSNSSKRDEAAIGAGAGAGAVSGHNPNAVVSGAGHHSTQPAGQDYTTNDRSAGNYATSKRNVQEPAFAPTANTGASNYEGVPQQHAGYTAGNTAGTSGYNTTETNQGESRGALAAAGAAVAGALGLGSYVGSGNSSETTRTTGNNEQTNLPSSGHSTTAGNYERSATGPSPGYESATTTGHSSHSTGPSATVATTGHTGHSVPQHSSHSTGSSATATTGHSAQSVPQHSSHSSSVPHGSQSLSSGNNDKLAGQIKQGGSTAQQEIGKSGASVGGVDSKTLGAGAAGAGAVGAAGATQYGKHHSSSQPTAQHSSTHHSTGPTSGSSSINHSSQPGYPSETVGTGSYGADATGHSSGSHPSVGHSAGHSTGHATDHSSQGPSSASYSQGATGHSSTGNNDKLAGQIKQGGNTAQQEIGKSGASVGGVDNKTLGAGAAGAGALGAAGATQYGNHHSSSQHSSSQPSATHSTSHSTSASQPQYSQSSSTGHAQPVTHTGRSGYPEESQAARAQGLGHSSGPSTDASGSQNLSSNSGNNDKLAGQIKQGGNTAQQEIGKSGASVGGVDNKTLGAGAAGAGALGAAGVSHHNQSHGSSSAPSNTQNYSQGSGAHHSSSHHSQTHHSSSHHSQPHHSSHSSQPAGYAGTTATAGAPGAREVPHGVEGHSTHGPATTSDHTSYGASGHAGQGSTGTSAPTSGQYTSGSGAGSTGHNLSSGNNDKLAGQIKQGGNTAQQEIGKSGASVGGVDNKTLGAGAAGAGAVGAAGVSHHNKSHGTHSATSGSHGHSTTSGSHGHSTTSGSHSAAPGSGSQGYSQNSGSVGQYTTTKAPTGDFEGPFNTHGHSASHELSSREASNGQTFGHSEHSHSGSGAAVGAGAGAVGAGAASHHHHSSTPSHSTQAPASSSSTNYQQQPATSHAATSAHHSTQSDAQGGRYVSNSDTNKYEQSPQYAQGNTYNSAGQPVADANGEPMQAVQHSEHSQSKGPLAAIAGALGFGGSSKAESGKSHSTVTSDNYNRDDYKGIGTSTDEQYRSGSSSGHQTSGLAHGTNTKHQPVDGVPIGSQYTDVSKGNSYKNSGKLPASYSSEQAGATSGNTTTLPEQRLPEEPVSGVAGKQPVELRTAGNGPIKYQ